MELTEKEMIENRRWMAKAVKQAQETLRALEEYAKNMRVKQRKA